MDDLDNRVERERAFHDALILNGQATIATKEWWETPGGKVRFSRRISLLKQSLPELSNTRHRILVIGCGDGEWVNAISEFAEVVGIDISPEIVANANRHLRHPAAATVEVGDAHRLNYADGTFDACFANSTLHHLDLHLGRVEGSLRVSQTGQIHWFGVCTETRGAAIDMD